VYAVSIALAHRGKVQQAVVYDPTRNDLFYASRGRGAFLNDKRLRVSKRTRLSDSLIGTGFPFRKGDNFKRYVKMFEEVMQSCAGLRRPGAAALDLCYVAAGWYDGFFETGLNPWDMAAGSLIITEAGGLVGNFTGEADFLYQREVVAGNPKVYGQLVQILAPYTRVIKEPFPGLGYPLVPGYETVGTVVRAGRRAACRHATGQHGVRPGLVQLPGVRNIFGGAGARLIVPQDRVVPWRPTRPEGGAAGAGGHLLPRVCLGGQRQPMVGP
jgi:hypothetical protein